MKALLETLKWGAAYTVVGIFIAFVVLSPLVYGVVKFVAFWRIAFGH